jgi:hypothetical protein
MSVKVQQYVPFPDSNAYWSEYYSNYGYPNYKYTYFIKGDTILNSLTYHKIYSDDSTSTIKYIGGLREYNKRIYYIDRYCSHNILLYNFNLNVGDSMKLSCMLCDTPTVYTKLTSIDSVILTNMKYRKRLNFDNGTYYPPWIEGIGCMGGLLYPYYSCTACMCGYESVCFEQNDTTLYTNPSPYNIYNCFDYITSVNELNNKEDLITIFPNPAASKLTIEAPQNSIIEILNIEGQLIKILVSSGNITSVIVSTFPSGMYFIKVRTEKGIEVKKFVKE